MFRRVGALFALTLVLLTGTATRADEANRECDNDQDVTVVVDFQGLGGGVNVRCAPQPIDNGFDALRNANISYDQYQGFICRIAGRPESEQCNRYPPSDAYWVYWTAPRGGQWKYSNYGAGARKPPPGSVDGWSFFLKSGDSDKPAPPRYPVPAPIVHDTPATTAGTAPAPPSSPAASTTSVKSSAATGRTTLPAAQSTTTAAPPESGETPAAAAATSSSVPFGAVDLSVDHGDGGTSTGFVVSAVAVTSLAALAFVFLRLRGR